VTVRLVFAALLCAAVCHSGELFAGRPLVVDDAPTVAAGNVELEFGFTHTVPEKGGRDQQFPIMTATYGLIKDLEVGLGIQRTNTDLRGERPVRGLQDLNLNAKYDFLKGDNYDLSLAFNLKVPTANSHRGLTSGRFDQAFLFLATKDLFPAAADLNLGYIVVGKRKGENLENRFFGGVAVRYSVSKNWRVVGDIYGLSRATRDANAEGNFQLGVRYHFGEFTMFDAAVGRSLLSSGHRFQATCGATWSTALNFGTQK
jgi:hypothetical protein